ncbi:MAG: hypothetical protein ACRD1R_05065 [Acidobacteriota bacterium]
MPNDPSVNNMILWIALSMGGIILGLILGYFIFGRKASNQRELESLRRMVEEREREVEGALEQMDTLRVALEEKTVKERRAMETLQKALQEDQYPALVEEEPVKKT